MPEPKLLPNRSIMHRWMAEPGSCDVCFGRGRAYDKDGLEIYPDCPCGRLRAQVEAPGHEEPANRITDGVLTTWPRGTPDPADDKKRRGRFAVGDRVYVVSAAEHQQCVYPDRRVGTVRRVLRDGWIYDVALDKFARVYYEPDQLVAAP